MFKKFYLLLLTLSVFFAASCSSYSPIEQSKQFGLGPYNSASSKKYEETYGKWGAATTLEKGTEFKPEMLGLTPGSTTADVNINWYSNSDEDESVVRLFDAEGEFVRLIFGRTGVASAGKGYHKVNVKGLTAGARYKYSVSNNGVDWSEEHHYSVPAAGTFRFAIVADPQLTTGNQDSASSYFSTPSTTAKGWEEVVEKIAESGASFIVSTGDQTDAILGSEAEYANFFAPEKLRSLPFAPVVGNHDVHCPFIYHFYLPNEQNVPETCTGAGQAIVEKAGNYFYLYNNVLFIALNTSAYPSGKEDAASYITVFENTIHAAKAAYAEKYDWIVVHHHKSTASVAIHAADPDIQYYVEAGFEALMTKHGIDLVLAGHDHIYVRSHLMKQDAADAFSVKSTDGKGTIYLSLTTASGLKYYPPFVTISKNANYPYLSDGKTGSEHLSASNPPLSMFMQSQKMTPEYTIVDVDGKSMTVTTYGSNGVVDRFTFSPTLAK